MAGDGLHYHDPSEGGDDGDAPDDEGSESELKQAAEEAFPDEDWSPERLDALKALMKLCMGEYGSDKPEKPMLSLLFGGKPKK
jgi:hypothetical protein